MQFPPLARAAVAAAALALAPFSADAARFFNLDASNIEKMSGQKANRRS